MSNPEEHPSGDEDPNPSDPHQDPALAAKARRDRLEQNRISARESRKRKKTMIEELQRTVITLSKENKELNERNEFLRRELVEIGTKHPGLVPIQALMRGGALAAAGGEGEADTGDSTEKAGDANPQAAVQQPMTLPQAAANPQHQMALMQQMMQMQAAAGMLGQQTPAMMALNPAFMMGMGMPQQQQQAGVAQASQGMPQQQPVMGQQEGQQVQQQVAQGQGEARTE